MKILRISAILISLLILLIVTVSCKKEDSSPVLPKPDCDIISPTDSTSVQIGSIVSVVADVSGFGDGVRVSFSVDSAQMSEALVAPWEFTWDTESWPLGPHTVRADAYESTTMASDKIVIIIIDTIIPLQAPVPVIIITPESGSTDTIFSFDASESYDQEDPPEDLLYRWDFDGDGLWDTDFSNENIYQHKYTHTSNYQVRLEVMDTDSMTADTIKSLLVIHSGNPDACEGYVSLPHGGQVYHTVAIGDQCWLKENMNIGVMINGSEAQSHNGIIEKYCYNDDTANCEKYGGLYMWNEMMAYIPLQGTKGICPNGWHIPSDDEWKELEGFADSQYEVGNPVWDETSFRGFDAGKRLKALLGWNEGGNGNNLFDLKVLPGGYWEPGFEFIKEGEEAHFWGSTHDSGDNGVERMLKFDKDQISRMYHWDAAAFSLRCLRD